MNTHFLVGVTRDFLSPDGSVAFGDIGLQQLDDAGIAWEFMPEHALSLSPRDLSRYDAVLLLSASVTPESLAGDPRTALIARFGVGYDAVDIEACTRAGIAVTITPDGVRRPVATALLTAVLALAHRLQERDRLVREGRWAEKLAYLGTGLTGRTLGIVGFGNIGRELAGLSTPLEMRRITYDPYADAEAAALLGVELVDLNTLLEESDFLCLCCPLTDATHHLIDATALSKMKPSAYLVNAARGAVVDEAALIDALSTGRISGAALDVFDPEPPSADNPLLRMDNVLLTPHCIAHTDECFRLTGSSGVRNILAVAQGKEPEHVVNRAVLTRPEYTRKLHSRQLTGGPT